MVVIDCWRPVIFVLSEQVEDQVQEGRYGVFLFLMGHDFDFEISPLVGI